MHKIRSVFWKLSGSINNGVKIMQLEQLLIEKFALWEYLSATEQAAILQAGVVKSVAAGECFLHGHGECSGVSLIIKGSFRAYILSEAGRDITLYRMADGEICVFSASCLLDEIDFDVFIDSETDSEVFIIPARLFQQLAADNLYVANFMYKKLAERFSDVMATMQQILFMKFDARLAKFLCDEQKRCGSCEIRLTHEEIARLMGSAREVVSRMLKYFTSEGIINQKRGKINIIDCEGLVKLARQGMEIAR